MAQSPLRPRRRVLILLSLLVLLSGAGGMVAAPKAAPISLGLDWYSVGSDVEIHFVRMPGGNNVRETHTLISRKSSKHYAGLSADTGGIPDWIDIEWLYGIVDAPTYEREHQAAKPAHARFDLKTIIPPPVRESLARDPARQQLRLIFTFDDDQLALRYELVQWRQ